MSRVPSLLLPAFVLTLACSPAEHEHRGPEFQFGAAPANPAAVQTIKLAPPHDAAEPGVRDDGSIVSAVDWFDGNLERALAKAEAEHKLVFVDVGAYWCPPCHELDEQVFTKPAVGDWLRERTIALHIDAEKGEGPEIVDRHRVQAYPTILVLEPSGVEKGRIVDFVPAEALIEQLEAIARGTNVLAELEAAVAASPTDLAALYRLAHAYTLAAMRDEADAAIMAVIVGDPTNEAGYASKVLYDRMQFFTLKLDNDPEAAILEFEALQKKFPDSKEATKAYRMIGRAHCKLGRPDQAVRALEAMVASDPNDVALKASFGWFAFRQNCRPDAGLAAVLAGIEQDPQSAELRYLEAELRRLLEQPEAGLAAIQKASELEPESAYYKRQIRRFEALVSG